MSAIKTFALAGVGNLGAYFADHLLSEKAAGRVAEVVILSRAGSADSPAITKLAAQGANIKRVDYDNADALVSALTGVDALISTLPFGGLLSQIPLAKAAATAGVKIFVPSEFGNSTDGEYAPGSPPALKRQVQKALKEIGIPHALVWTGAFPDFDLAPPFGFDFAGGKVHICGEGNGPISWTARIDIARFVTYVLLNHPVEEIARILRIEGDRKTLNEIVTGYESVKGKKLDVTHSPRADLEKALQANPADFRSYIFLVWDTGDAVTGDKLDNDLYPAWNPKKVVDLFAET